MEGMPDRTGTGGPGQGPEQADPMLNSEEAVLDPTDPENMTFNPDDIEEVILDETGAPQDGEMVDELGDMDLEHYGDPVDMEGAEAAEAYHDDANITFTGHKGSVFSVDLDQSSYNLVVTGAEDDKAFVWNITSGVKLFECTGHKDSVTCVMFSHDSTLVATGDMSGLIKVWKVEDGSEIWSFEVSDLEWLHWHHSAHVLLAGTTDGDVWMWKIPGGDCKTLQSHGYACNIGRVMPDGKRLIAGYEDGAVKVWDLKSTSVSQTFSGFTGHNSSITSMDCHQDGHVIITGSTDMTAKVLNTTNGKVLSTYSCSCGSGPSSDDSGDDSVEAVGFSKVQNLAATGTLQGNLSIWDISTQSLRHQCKQQAGIVRLAWDQSAPLLYTCSLDGSVSLWDARSGSLEKQWLGHTQEVLDMCVARNGSVIVTASGDHTSKVFKLHGPDR